MRTVKYILTGLIFIFTLCYICLNGILPGWENVTGDFNNYYAASKALLEGDDLSTFFDNSMFNERAKELGVSNGAKFAPFPPITTFFMIPFASLGLIQAKQVWLIINLMLLVILPFRLKRYFGLSMLQSLLILCVFFAPISVNLNYGQFYIFISFLSIEIIGLNRKKDAHILTGVILAILTSVKYLPILFLLYAFNGKQNIKRLLVSFFTSSILIIILISLFYPNTYSIYCDVLFNHLNGDLSGQGKYAIGFQSLDSLLNNFFVYSPLDNPEPFINNSFLKPVFKMLFMLSILVSWLHLISKDKFKLTSLNISFLIFGAFTLFPASASYHFILLLLPTVFVWKWLDCDLFSFKLFVFVFLLFATFLIQRYHIPNFQSMGHFNLLFQYPRFLSLCLVYAYLYIIRLKEVS